MDEQLRKEARLVLTRIPVFLGLLLVAASNGYAAKVSAAALDEVLGRELEQSHVPSISVAIVEDGKIRYAKAVGFAELPGRKATEDTRYAIGSISKQFTVAALLLAEEEGKLSLDDTVSKYFPDYTAANQITIRQLLSHISGYEDYAPQDYIIPAWTQPTDSATLLGQWATKPLDFKPGTQWQYSNTGYVLAAQIFEKAYGEPLVAFLARRIFNPLGMKSPGDCSVSKTPEDAVAYTRYGLGMPRAVAREAPGWYLGAGELCMTPSDVARWNLAVLHHKVLSEQSYAQFTQEAKLRNGSGTHYALGLQVGEREGQRSFSHSGEVSGFLSQNIVLPLAGLSVTVCSNQDNSPVVFSVANQLLHLVVQGEGQKSPRKELEQVRSMLLDLSQGAIDRKLLTPNASSYFSPVALEDIRQSLAPLGKLDSIRRTAEGPRGGMLHRSYEAQFDKALLDLNVYVTADGHVEQFLISTPR